MAVAHSGCKIESPIVFAPGPPQAGTVGSSYIDTINGDLHQKLSGTWTLVGSLIGPQGLQGPQGIPGDTGPQGNPGPQGNTGPIGPVGPQGVQGVAGPTGAAGPQGIQGDPGPQGAAGPAGPQGIQGAQGERGESFTVDDAGDLTEAVVTDIENNSGASLANLYWFVVASDNRTNQSLPGGISGDQSLNAIWYDGTNWHSAGQFTGQSGPPGAQGQQGIQGPAGPQGATGQQGPAGIEGPPGPGGAASGLQFLETRVADVGTTQTSFTTYLSLNHTYTKSSSQFLLQATGLWGGNSGSQDIVIQLVVNGSVLREFQKEPKDTAGSGPFGTDQKESFVLAADLGPKTLGQTDSIAVQFASSQSGNLYGIYNCEIAGFELV